MDLSIHEDMLSKLPVLVPFLLRRSSQSKRTYFDVKHFTFFTTGVIPDLLGTDLSLNLCSSVTVTGLELGIVGLFFNFYYFTLLFLIAIVNFLKEVISDLFHFMVILKSKI